MILGIFLTALIYSNEFVLGKYSAYNYENTYNLHYGKNSHEGKYYKIIVQ